MRVPAALVAVPLLAGAAAGVQLFDTTPDGVTLTCAAAAALLAIAAAGFLADDLVPASLVCVVAGCALAGWSMGARTAAHLEAPPLVRWFEARRTPEDPAVVDGILREDAALMSYGAVLTLDVVSVQDGLLPARPAGGGVRLVVGGAAPPAAVPEWTAGRRIRATASLRRPAWFSNPGVADDRRVQALRGIALTGSIKSAALVEVTCGAAWIEEVAAAARAWIRRVITAHVGRIDRRSAAIAIAILVGDRTGLPDEDEQRLQDAGTYHVIAISGGNIAILAALLLAGARLARLPFRAGPALAIVVLLFYAEVAGGTASVGRAVSAAVIFLVALLADHRGAPLNVVAVAAVLACAWRPVVTVDGGFLLSFGATAGIVVGVPRLVATSIERRGTMHRAGAAVLLAARGVAVATLCAEVALAPIGASLFSRITFAGLLLNFAAIPLMTSVQCGSMVLLAAAAAQAPGLDLLARIVHVSAWGLVESARLVDVAPWAARDVAPPAWWLCALYYSACAALLAAPRFRRVSAIVLLAAVVLLVSGAAPDARAAKAPPPGTLRVVVLDVGQGDATVAILPDGRAILVDAGGLAGTSLDIGGRVVVPALRALGVRRLHALVVTHADPDHAGGLEAVLRRVGADNIWEGTPVPPNPLLRSLMQLASTRRAVWRTLRPGDVERAGGAAIIVHHPPEPDWERQRVRNDDSVILELRHGDVSILLPGDIGSDVEAALVPRLTLAPLVVLKAAHHGSATSSGVPFLDAVHPRAVIFSAGRNNRFGHPAQLVVERFSDRGVQMFTTADDGAVFVETDGRSVTVRGWRSGRKVAW